MDEELIRWSRAKENRVRDFEEFAETLERRTFRRFASSVHEPLQWHGHKDGEFLTFARNVLCIRSLHDGVRGFWFADILDNSLVTCVQLSTSATNSNVRCSRSYSNLGFSHLYSSHRNNNSISKFQSGNLDRRDLIVHRVVLRIRIKNSRKWPARFIDFAFIKGFCATLDLLNIRTL